MKKSRFTKQSKRKAIEECKREREGERERGRERETIDKPDEKERLHTFLPCERDTRTSGPYHRVVWDSERADGMFVAWDGEARRR